MKTAIKNLLSINRKAFRFLHGAEGFDFEQPYFITEQPGKFTINTVKKAVQARTNPAECKIVVFVVPTKTSHRSGLYFATLERGKFNGCRIDGVNYWDYRTGNYENDIDYCYGFGDFEDLRKNQTEKIFIIAQEKAHIEKPKKKELDLFARYTLINAKKHGDGRGNTYIGEMDLKATDGSSARFEYRPYSSFYGYETKSADIESFIDNSGYLLRPHRFELIQKANKLRADRAKAGADSADFTKETKELQEFIEKARGILSGAVLTCNDSTAADELTSKMKSFSYALYYFAEYEKKIASKQYASIDRITADIEDIKTKLNYCITGNK